MARTIEILTKQSKGYFLKGASPKQAKILYQLYTNAINEGFVV